ncbi:MAG: alcohol dehydrogenase [Gammaproteobacteria bacterium]|nr:MAG: alcohol dehydrogenase [Gammaproteobacteria bacterium]
MNNNWKSILVSPNSTILEVLKVIDREALQLAIVIDNQQKLLGTVTDGDIRRALIDDKALSAEISEVMFTSPITLPVNTSKSEVLSVMENKGILAIPLMKDKHVVGLATLKDLIQHAQYENPIFIMAGGFGTRLKPLTDHCPKPMLKVGDKPILETLLLRFRRAGFQNFYISTHYLPEVITNYFGDGSSLGINITYINEDKPLGTGGALGLLPSELIELPTILINGDILTTLDFSKLLEFHSNNKACATMCVREYEYKIPYGVIESEGISIKKMVEKPTHRYSVNAGIYVLEPSLIHSVEKNVYIDMPSLLEEKLGENENVNHYTFHDYWLDIGQTDDYHRAQLDIGNLSL